MKGILDHGTRSKIIKLASAASWYYPYKPYILFSFGIEPGERDSRTALYSKLKHWFAARSERSQDVIYLWETLAEYYYLAEDLLLEVGFPLVRVRYLVSQMLQGLFACNETNIIDTTTQSVKLMQDYMETYLHDVTSEPPLLRWQGDSRVKQICSPFLAVITATRSGELRDLVQVVYTLRTLSEYLGRVRLTSRFDDLVDSAIADYKKQEAEMGDWEYDHSLLYDMQDVIAEWYPEAMWLDEMEHLSPILSGGSPYGSTRRMGAGHYYKFNNLRVNAFLLAWQTAYWVADGLPDYDFDNVFEKTDDRDEYGLEPLPPSTSLALRYVGDTAFKCELVFVPKTARKVRSISKEEPYLQYLQHGVQHAMVRIGRKTALRKHVDYADAARSAEMARWGSWCGAYATLDLSAASDSVSLETVICAFPKYMRDALLATRSEFVVLPDKTEIRMNKFAPMGSATCFPTETTVFAAICEVAKRRSGIRNAHYWVYGDDIVVDERLVSTVVDFLGRLNFKVNNLKSFTGYTQHSFREACGGEYLDGKDVTPLRVSRQRSSVWAMSTEVILSEYQDMMHTEWLPYRRLARLHYIRLSEMYPEWSAPTDRYFFGTRDSRSRAGRPLSEFLNWRVIKDHAVYNPMGDGLRMHHYKDGTYGFIGDKPVSIRRTTVYPSETYSYGSMGEDKFGQPILFQSDAETTALTNWLAKANRRPEQDEYATQLESLIMTLNELDADDSYTNPVIAPSTSKLISLEFRDRQSRVRRLGGAV